MSTFWPELDKADRERAARFKQLFKEVPMSDSEKLHVEDELTPPVSRVVPPEPRLIRADDVDASCDLDFGTCREAFPKDSASWCHGCVIAGLLAEHETARQQLAEFADSTKEVLAQHRRIVNELTRERDEARQQLDTLKAAILSHVPQEHHGTGAWDTVTTLAALAKAHAQDSELLDRIEDGGSRREVQARFDALIAALREQISAWRDEAKEDRSRGELAMAKITTSYAIDIEAVLARYGGKE